MKVLYITSVEELGGASRSLMKLVLLLKQKGINPILVTNPNNNTFINFCKNNNIELILLKHYKMTYTYNNDIKSVIKLFISPIYAVFTYIMNIIAIKKLSKMIDLNEIDLIHSNLPRYELGLLLSKKYNIKHVMHLREYGTLDFNSKFLRINYYKFLNKYCNKFIAISSSIKDFYVKNGLSANKVEIIYNGVSSNIPFKDNYKENNNIKIVILSNISREKGQIQVIDALSMLDSKNIHLYLYGNCPDDYRKILDNKIKKLNVSNRVHFMGHKNNATEYLRLYDIAITPSKNEAFGRVTIEYMFSKLPVIASDTGANTEIVLNNKTGLIYEYGNIESLKEAITKLANSYKLRREYGENGYKIAKEKFTDVINANNIYDLYCRMR